MSDHEFTEKEINNFIRKYQGEKGWLNARSFRSNPLKIKVSDLEWLMQTVVFDRRVAFDNRTLPNSGKYNICFNLDEIDKMIEELEDSSKYGLFDNLESIGMIMDHFLSESLPNSIKTWHQLYLYTNIKVEWFYTWVGFRRYQQGKNIKGFHFCDLLVSTGNHEEIDRDILKDFPPSLGSYNSKDLNKYISIKIDIFTNMYKALKTGWDEVEDFYPQHTYNTFFLELLINYYTDKLVRPRSSNEYKYWSNLPKIIAMKKFPDFIENHLEFLSKNKDLDKSYRDHYCLIWEEYKQDPHGQGLDRAFNALKEVAKTDSYVFSELEEYYKSFSMLGSYPGLNFKAFLNCSNPGEFVYHNELTDHAIFYQSADIKEIFLKSPNLRVRKALSEWLAAEKKIIAFQRTMWQKNAGKKDVDR